MGSKYLKISSEIEEALQNHRPVVALESTIIAHGMPFPKNADTAMEVEAIVRSEGAVPATIAIIGGELRVGLSADEIRTIGRSGPAFAKISRRDIPVVVSGKGNGACTVASTMIIAAMAGIRIFATGGIGGVHRGGTTTMDVSADLQELAKTNVAVVCAGAKSILDIGLTLEYLETMGVPVIGYQTRDFPAFYTQKSGFKNNYSVENEAQLADILHAKWEMGLQGGVVVANPIPADFAMEESYIQQAIDDALREAQKQNLSGKAVTPFLLARIEQLTRGKSLEANIQLVYNNARLAGRLARAYCSSLQGTD